MRAPVFPDKKRKHGPVPPGSRPVGRRTLAGPPLLLTGGCLPVMLRAILENALPETLQDMVVVFVTVIGNRNGRLMLETFALRSEGGPVGGRPRSAIQLATVSSICAMPDLLAAGNLPQCGFVRQEEIDLALFLQNRFGKVFSGLTRGRWRNQAFRSPNKGSRPALPVASDDATGHDLRMVGQKVRHATAKAGMDEISRFPIVSPTWRGPGRPASSRAARTRG